MRSYALPRWQLEDIEYAKLLATFEQLIPLRQRSGLTEPGLAREILIAADGLIGGVANLLRQAAVEAVRNCDVVHVRLSGLRLRHPRQWGACWLTCQLWDQLR